MTQERRRYGFVLERQCSLSKHYLSYYGQGVEAYQENIEKWSDVAKTREYLPESVENIFSSRLRVSHFIFITKLRYSTGNKESESDSFIDGIIRHCTLGYATIRCLKPVFYNH